MSLLFLSSFVVRPASLRRYDIGLLALLRPATDQNHKALAILAEVDAAARAEVDFVFVNARADALGL